MNQEDKLKEIMESALHAQGSISYKDAEALIAATVATTLLQIGVDPHNLIETQRDAAFLRKWRTSYERAEQYSWKTIVSIVLTGIMALLVLGLKDWLHLT